MTDITPKSGANGRQAISVTGTAVALPSANGVKAVIVAAIQAISTLGNAANSDTILVGVGAAPTWGASYTGIALAPGESLMITMDETNDIYINGVAGDGVTYTYIF